MELFKVTCVTCQAKLSVRNAALIGEIVACPKCESMVLVAAPESAPPQDSPSPATVSEPVAQVADEIQQPAQSPGSNFDSEAAETPPTEIPTPDEVPNLTVDTTSAGSKVILGWIASFAIGASVTGAFLVFLQQEEPKPAVVAATQNLEAEEDNSKVKEKSPIATEPVEEKKPEANPGRPSAGMSSNEGLVAELEETPSAITPPAKTQPPQVNDVDETVTPTETIEQAPPSPKLVVESPDSPRIANKFDPLRFDLEQMDLGDLSTTENTNEATAPLPPQPPHEEGDNLIKQQPLEKPAVVRLSDNNSKPFSKRSAEEHLTYKVPSLTVKDMILTDFLGFVGSLSGLPISVAPIELQMAGVSPGKQLSIDAQEIRLDEALSQVLKPLHLEFITVGPQVVIIRADADRVRKINYPIDDLTGTQTSAENFAKWIEELIAPESWAEAGGIGTISASAQELQVEQTQGVHFRILFFLERIRLAKHLPLRSRYPARLLGAKPHGLEIADRISTATTFTFSHETPLAEVFRYWQSEMGLPVFVDWPALAKRNLWPDSRITCHITNKSWHGALDAVLIPLELGWRAGPGGTIQITSQDALQNEAMLDIYPADLWQNKTNGKAKVIHDAGNNLVYVRASAAELRKGLGR